jgi:transketolase
VQHLEDLAREARLHVIDTVAANGVGHVGGPLSAMDLLIALYFRQLRVDPDNPADPDRDRFILSKGHSAIGLYAVLALRGYFPVEELATFDVGGSRLQGHPDMDLTPGIDSSTGSLGQGPAVGLGMALGAKRLGRPFHTWVLVGDGEMQEGMVWESILCAPRYQLDNLTLIVDCNGLQQFGWPPSSEDRFDRSDPIGHLDLRAVFEGCGWNVIEIDGHDFSSILEGYRTVSAWRGCTGKPSVIVARTVKGQGVSFARGTYKWHNGVPSADELDSAHAELRSTQDLST